MPFPPVKTEDIYEESNMLLLTKSLFFQDTTRIPGSRCAPSFRRVEPRFFGYVYRCVDADDITFMFENGIFPIKCNLETGVYIVRRYQSYAKSGHVLTDVSTPLNLLNTPNFYTYICYYQARYLYPSWRNHTFLIDIRELGGIVHKTPSWSPEYKNLNSRAFDGFPITKKIFDVVITYPVSASKIVGVIKELPSPNLSQHSEQLKLYVNPNYTGGMEGAMAVAASFNGESFYGESQWEVV
ncbi:hypothetical protein NX722_07255 [Endozoicomonas gorgoniicola]|uniref:Uncharacterized protein n=1 Tax=Endozoicomonas gorgoniicola TaxID=1234144 RepID=A0ABT3MSV9_9GAMM|nr:hypothetical protein [Endozoicomonas gorgoniicola]MCW7552443.1 hypothetical protein [Endozoicomonas gorgoniicola]